MGEERSQAIPGGGIILRHLPIPLGVKSLPDRQFILWNEAAERFLGVEARDVLQTRGEHLFEARAAEGFLAAETAAIRSMSPGTFKVGDHAGPRGARLDFQGTIIPLKEDRNRFLLLVFEPTRASRLLEDEIRHLRGEMLTVVSEQKKTFAYLNHQVRTGLANITGMLEKLLGADLETTLREMGETALISSIAIMNVLNESAAIQMKNLRRVSLESLDFDPARLLETVVELNADAAFRKGIDLGLVIHPEVPGSVTGDPECLQQILQNLIENSLRSTAKGRLRLAMQMHDRQGDTIRLRFEFRELKEEVCRLAGEGEATTAGRAAASLAAPKGIMLEFLHARNLAELLGGDIIADPRPADRSCLSFVCPFPTPACPAPERSAALQAAGRLLLVGHPHQVTRQALEEQWKAWGGSVIAAESPELTLKHLRESAEGRPPISLVAIDAFWNNLPGLGFDAPAGGPATLHGFPCLRLIPWETGNRTVSRPAADSLPTLVLPVLPSRWLELLPRLLPSAAPKKTAEAPGVGLEVLLVDGNESGLRLARRLLEGLGCRVTGLNSSKEALKRLIRHPADLVFLACEIPDLDGFETARRLRKRERGKSRRTPIIALADNAQPEFQARSVAAGMDGLIARPFKRADFLWALERWAPPRS